MRDGCAPKRRCSPHSERACGSKGGDGLRWVVWEGVEGAGAELRRRVPGASFFRYVVGREPWILAGLRADQRLRSLRSPLV